MKNSVTIGVVAPSAPVGKIELEMGVARLKAEGWQVRVHPQVRKKELFFAGSDRERAQAVLDFAFDESIEVLWCARGGYGAFRLLELLDQATRKRGAPPRKHLLGYSDATALLEFARTRWGWQVAHAPMVGTREFSEIPDRPWSAIRGVLEGRPSVSHAVKWLSGTEAYLPKRGVLRAPLVGGNLAVLASLVGTPYAPQVSGSLLFLEEVTEAPYRMDRMLRQWWASGGLDDVKALVLGTFTGCEDSVFQVLAEKPGTGTPRMKPLRARVSHARALQEIFGSLGERLRIPVAMGLPVGHGGGFFPLPLGERYALSANPSGSKKTAGVLEWLDSRKSLR